MKIGIIGKKVGMTQVFGDGGVATPITVVDTSECVITQVKTKEKDGYSAVQIGFGEMKPQNANKALGGHYKKAGTKARRSLTEIRVESDEPIAHLKAGQSVSPSLFAKGDKVDVTGVTKGKGFQGVVKRHGYHGANASRGAHEAFRHGGSIGMGTDPGRVLKNKKMAGQMGNVRRTAQSIEVVDVKEKEGLLFLKGAVPGAKSGLLIVRNAVKSPPPSDRKWA